MSHRKRKRAQSGSGVQMFPFLDALICTMGALLVLLHAFARHGTIEAVKKAETQSTASPAEATVEREELEWRINQLKEVRAKAEEQLADERQRLSHVEDHQRRLREQFDQMRIAAEELERTGKKSVEEDQQALAQLAQTTSQVSEARKAVADSHRLAQQKAATYSVVPYEGPNSTRRRPVYIECRADSVVLQPEGIELPPDCFVGYLGPGNPLASALRGMTEYYARQSPDAKQAGEPYPLLLVRPEGIGAYYAARGALDSWGTEFGYELVGSDWKLQFSAPDPRLAEITRQVVIEARARQREYLASTAQMARSRPRATYHASSRGGFTPDRGGSGGGGRGGASDGRGPGGWDSLGSNWANGEGAGSQDASGGGTNPNGGGTALGGAGGGTTLGGTGGGGDRLFGGNGGGAAGNPGAQGGDGTNPGGGPSAWTGGDGRFAGGGVGGGGGSATGGGQPGSPGGPMSNASGTGSGSPGADQNGSSGTASSTDRFSSNSRYGSTSGAGGGQGNGASGGKGNAPSTSSERNPNPDQDGSGDPNGISDSKVAGAKGNAGRGSAGGSGAASGGSATGGSGSSSGSSSPISAGSPAPNFDNSAPVSKTHSMAKTRGRDWGLPDASPAAVAATRPILVECHNDRLVIVPESRNQLPKEVKLSAKAQDSMDEFVSDVWQHMKGWGMAGKNLYWRPTLIMEVKPGAADRYAEVKALLADSGLDVHERKPPTLATPPAKKPSRR